MRPHVKSLIQGLALNKASVIASHEALYLPASLSTSWEHNLFYSVSTGAFDARMIFHINHLLGRSFNLQYIIGKKNHLSLLSLSLKIYFHASRRSPINSFHFFIVKPV